MTKTYKRLNRQNRRGQELYEETLTVKREVTLEEKQEEIDDNSSDKDRIDNNNIELQGEIDKINTLK